MSSDSFSKEYLLSDKYVRDIMGKANVSYEEFIKILNDAESATQNYNYRHNPNVSNIATKLGAWRWKGLFTYREQIVPILFDKELKGVDFGGAARPISRHLDIVDLVLVDYYDRPVKYNSLAEIKHKLDFVFSSHALEHIQNLNNVLDDIYSSLKIGGKLILNLPNYTCNRWRANSGLDMGGTPHVHTFKLSKTVTNQTINSLKSIDTLLEDQGFEVTLAEYTGDDSIIIMAKK
tara:strand:- start:4713 stop:5414 length:702 start_codon:yes stop_codon:yes gene_type:complete